jgi:hypothetical protein
VKLGYVGRFANISKALDAESLRPVALSVYNTKQDAYRVFTNLCDRFSHDDRVKVFGDSISAKITYECEMTLDRR